MNRWLAGRVAWPVTERLLRRDTMTRLRELRASERLDPEARHDLRSRKLRRLLAAAGEHCPFYAERLGAAGVDPADPNLTIELLSALPTLTRDDVRAHVEAMSWPNCPRGGAQPYNTGGSSGEPLKFYIDRCRQSADWAARWRARAWWGVRPGDREVLLWAAPSRPTAGDRLRQWRDALLNQHTLDAFDMTEATMTAYFERIRRRRPACLYGYAGSLALLARFALTSCSAGRMPASLRAVFVTGEVLTEADRRDIEAAFGAPAVVEYGSRDCGFIAGAGPCGQLHVAEENVIVELLDAAGRPALPGEVGEVVVTCLESFATPLIRYRIGDLAEAPAAGDASQCTCGRSLARLTAVRGRVTDQIACRTDDGIRHMHALSLIYVLREADGLCQFRIVQKSLDELDVEVVTNGRFTPAVEQEVVDGLRQRMGGGTLIGIRRCDRIAPGPAGKHACVVSHVSPQVGR